MENSFQFSNFHFGLVDCLVFSLMLLGSVAIGLFYGCCQKKKQDTADFLMAGRSMTVFPVAMSLIASFMSSITLLGTPSEVYSFGMMIWLVSFTFFVSIPIAMTVYMPVFWNLRLTSVHEYLELRFNRNVKLLATSFFMMYMVVYMSLVAYGPALALAQVMNMNHYVCVVLTCVICIFYTSLGGLKAVLWSDALQLSIMYGSLFFILIKGTIDLGGIQKVWEIGSKGGRTALIDFDPHPHKKYTIWSISVGAGCAWVGIFGVLQPQVQRYLCLNSKSMLHKTMWFSSIGNCVLFIMCAYAGLMIYAAYWQCDPTVNGIINQRDQIFPLFVLQRFGSYPGLPGLFVAGVFAGALSSISSGLNSLATVVIQDFFIKGYKPNLCEKKSLLLSKLLSVFFGVATLGFVFLVEQVGSMLPAVYLVLNAVIVPILGMFTLGMILPFTNSISAFCSALIGMGTSVFFSANQLYARKSNLIVEAKLDVGKCGNWTFDDIQPPYHSTWLSNTREDSFMYSIYKISYMWFTSLSLITMLISAIIISWATGNQNVKKLNPKLVSPMVYKLAPIFSSIRSIGTEYVPDEPESTVLDESELENSVMDQNVTSPHDSNRYLTTEKEKCAL